MKRVAGVFAVALAGLMMPATASAQWFANPYLGSISKINFSEPHEESASVWGIAGGAGAMLSAGRLVWTDGGAVILILSTQYFTVFVRLLPPLEMKPRTTLS